MLQVESKPLDRRKVDTDGCLAEALRLFGVDPQLNLGMRQPPPAGFSDSEPQTVCVLCPVCDVRCVVRDEGWGG
jgi:hypothetical protein